jgi:hypothetical protein
MDFQDQTDHCDDNDDIAGQADNCIVFNAAVLNEGDALAAPGT